MSNASINYPAGVIGAGKFGLTVAKLLSNNTDVIIYARNEEKVHRINENQKLKNITLPKNIKAVNDLGALTEQCVLIFPVVPSSFFRNMMVKASPHLRPEHILIHGTKGLDIKGTDNSEIDIQSMSISQIKTMSEVIKEESSVIRVGCLSGPNLSDEILAGQPSATVLASEFDEVIQLGRKVLSSPNFSVFGTHDIKGAELAATFKNYIAIGAGMLDSKGYGRNVFSLLLSKGLREMIHLGQLLGASNAAFLGTAGIADLIATSTSDKSRNYKLGYRLGQGELLIDVINSMDEIAEGAKTLAIANQLALQSDLQIPITKMLYQVIFHNLSLDVAIKGLMRFPFAQDVDFL